MIDNNLLAELSSIVETGEHTKFQLLQNWQEYKFTRKVKFSTNILIKYLKELADAQIKSYCAAVVNGSSDVTRLLAYKHICSIIDFYAEERLVVTGMLEEYECYLLDGNWLDFVFNSQRPFNKLYDQRGE